MRKKILRFSLLLLLFSWFSPDVHAILKFAVSETHAPQEKEKTVKVLIRKNGKLIEKDSIFVDNGKGISINGDSIKISESGTGSEKMIIQTIYINEDNVKEGKGSKSYTYTYSVGDTLRNDIQRKVKRLGDQRKLIIMQESKGDTFGTESVPSGAAVLVEGRQIQDPYAFDSADPNIVSYKKKDVGKGQEKITIVRKKSVAP